MKKYFAAAIMLAHFQNANAQDTTKTAPAFTVSGYLEAYYNYDFNRPLNNTTPSFLYNFNRAGEVNVNLGFVKGSYNSDRVRANLALAVGTYMNANYAAEPGVLKNIYEANAGVKLTQNANLWLDAGIMPSHIGFESAIGKDNWAMTRSLVAENSPYFESGAKLNYTSNNG
ncbi:outer membrane beta-barrel protein, partial [Dyadobacter sp.]|uniref:outer membrane beta-barrel protein n=1 Tax=Dyadobacter sp. TaxID=1914288 RepID=UPI003F706AAC